MTREDTKKMIMYLRMAFRDFCSDKDLTMVVDVWHDAFKDEDTAVVSRATQNYVKHNPYPPTIAGIIEQMRLLKEKETDTDLWSLIQKAVRNGTYGAKEEFEKLPPECQSFVGSPASLKELAQIDTGTMNTIVKGQFLKRVEAIKEHQEVQKGLPAEVRQAIEESKLRMLEGEFYD